jgi:hypothetical protein
MTIYLLFDFDCTLTSHHSFYFLHDFRKFIRFSPSVDIKRARDLALRYSSPARAWTTEEEAEVRLFLFGSEERVATIVSFLTRLQELDPSIQFRILSHGYQDEISTFLRIAGLTCFFPDDHIYGRGGDGKEETILSLLQSGQNHVLYLDDCDREHQFVLDRAESLDMYHYHPLEFQGQGMQEEDWQEVFDKVESWGK